VSDFFQIECFSAASVLTLVSPDGTNRLSRACVLALTSQINELSRDPLPLIVTGNERFFSAGADLHEIAGLQASATLEFARMGQRLMSSIASFPAPVYAAVRGYCMGGGLDLALACRYRIASSNAIFGHRGASLGLITGWGGTQRLLRHIGKPRALQVFLTAEKLHAVEALRVGLISAIADDPVAAAREKIASRSRNPQTPLEDPSQRTED
jgi:enoyl-CoA hydratase/carnithine racemase